MPWLRIKPVFLLSGSLFAGLHVSVAPIPGCAAQEAEPASFDLPPNALDSTLPSQPHLPAFLITVPSTCDKAGSLMISVSALDSLRMMEVHLDDTPRNQPFHRSDFPEVPHVASFRKLPWMSASR